MNNNIIINKEYTKKKLVSKANFFLR